MIVPLVAAILVVYIACVLRYIVLTLADIWTMLRR